MRVNAGMLPGALLLIAAGAAAAGDQAAAENPAVPDPALLEYLGSFPAEEGEWVDPLELAEVEATELRNEADDEAAATAPGKTAADGEVGDDENADENTETGK